MKRVVMLLSFLLLAAFAFAPITESAAPGAGGKAARAKVGPNKAKQAGKVEWLVLSAGKHQNERRRAVRAEHTQIKQKAEDKVYVAVADLNNDGANEVIVYFDTIAECGAVGCTFCIYGRKGKLLESIAKPELLRIDAESKKGDRQPKVGILPSTTLGWHDIALADDIILRWDGKKYDWRSASLEADRGLSADIFAKVSPSIVALDVYDEGNKLLRSGSGVVVPGRQVATSCRVVEGASGFLVRWLDEEHSATVLYGDRDRDVCILSAPGMDLPAATFGSTKSIERGARIFAVGSDGEDHLLSGGIVEDVVRVAQGRYIPVPFALRPGENGGGLFDKEARLLGITVPYLDGGNTFWFTVPVEWVTETMANRTRNVAIVPKGKAAIDLLNRSLVLEAKEDWAALIDHSTGWTKAYPSDPAAWYSLGTASGRSGRITQAIEALATAVRLNPDDDMAWHNLAYAYEKSNNTPKAIEAYEQVVRLNPKNASAWYNLGVVYKNAGQEEKAIGVYRKLKTLDMAEATRFLAEMLGRKIE